MAQALGKLLREEGFPVVCIASRTMTHAEAAAAFIGPEIRPVSYSGLIPLASRILMAVPDSAISDVSDMIARAGITGGIALHTCGTLGPEALSGLMERGVACGTLHPLQTVADAQQGVHSLRGCAFAIDGDEQAIDWATHIVTCLRGEVLRIPQDRRPLYHAAAVMASNYVVGLMHAAQQLMNMAGVDEKTALRALAPLLRSTVENVTQNGPAKALTGPIERGDSITVAAHTRALAAAPQQIQDLYRAAGLQVLEIAHTRGLPASAVSAIEEVLRGD
jgi:predicted short-subunit dehydrogenase-like oxidoreductase (DUF2520 family)